MATATIDLTRRSPDTLGLTSRRLDLSFVPVVNSGDGSAIATHLHGTIRSRATADRLDLHFGEACVKAQPPVSRTVGVKVHVPAKAISARIEPNYARHDVRESDGRKGEYLVSVTPDIALEAKSYTASLVVAVIDEAGAEHFGISLPVTFELLPAKPAFPRRVYLPTGSVGKPIEARLDPDPRAGPLLIEAVESSSDELTAQIDRRIPGIVLSVVAKELGAGKASMVVRVTDEKTGARMHLAVEVLYTAE
ncbi:MAG TPA: hypothetical protein VKD71_01255 [Gemmataceae bacterium]|nr:hypothetical protein [Gemmataceae bacterium]